MESENSNNALALNDLALLFNSGVLKSAQVKVMVSKGVRYYKAFLFRKSYEVYFCKGILQKMR